MMKRSTSISVEQAIQLLRSASDRIKYRETVKEPEKIRIKDALQALDEPSDLDGPNNRKKYRTFLSQVLKSSGRQMVILCAIGLGQTRVIGMNENNRLSLLPELEKQKRDLVCATLMKLDEFDWTTC